MNHYRRHILCRRLYTDERKRLGLKIKDIKIVCVYRGVYEVILPKPFGNRGCFAGCCKWDASRKCMAEIQIGGDLK